MAQTPLSSSTPYCSAANFLVLRDWRTVADLVTDDDARPDQSATLASAVVAKALLAASGDVDRRALVGGKYTPSDLAAIAADAGSAGASLQGLVADLAFWRLAKRRWPRCEPRDVSGAEEALQVLKELEEGLLIFGTVEAAAAGLPAVTTLDPLDDRVTVRAARRYFGNREPRGLNGMG